MVWTESERREMAEALVRETRAAGGLAPVDLERYYADQKIAAANPWGRDIPQCPVGSLFSHECVFAELDVPEDWYRLTHDHAWRLALVKRYNDKAESIVGRRPLGEGAPPDPLRQYPPVKGLHDIFEGEYVWNNESYWLKEAAHSEDELRALLDRAEKRLDDLRAFVLPAGWDAEKKRLSALGVKPPLYRHQRGPVTFATSIYGVERFVYLLLDSPDLAVRFRDLILRAMLELGRVLDEEAGYTPETAPHGFSFADDNCYLMTPAMYELFGFPILKAVWERYSPDPGDVRFQHSDSAMGHLLPVLGRLNLTGTNFGPTVTVADIRRHMPAAVIHGQLAPFTYSRNQEVRIVEEFLRDFDMAREKRGLVFGTAGSINNGSRLTGARLIMAAVQRYGRFDV